MSREANATVSVVKAPGSSLRDSRVHAIKRKRDVLVPMRDKTVLAVDFIAPESRSPLPLVLIRTAYNKSKTFASPFAERLAHAGFIVAIQDCRGRFNSDGIFDPYRQGHIDGYDTIQWLAGQD